MDGYDRFTYGEVFADVYDDWYADVTPREACAAFLAEVAGGRGPVVELGVGTGRLARPLAAHGLPVVGVDVSPVMLRRLATTTTGDPGVLPVQADMVALPLRGPFPLVFVSFSTFFNLVDPGSHAAALAEVARVLGPDGRFVLEAFVPRDDLAERRNWVSVRTVERDRLVLHAGLVDVDDQTVAAQHVEITEAGIRLRPLFIRYLFPDQLDALAAAAGLTLEARHGGWAGEAFDDDAGVHVSVYRGVA